MSGPATPDNVPLDRELGNSSADSGLFALALVAAHYRIVSDPIQLRHNLGLGTQRVPPPILVRAANHLGLKGRCL
ncbi:hypothetical protein QR510_29875, partial [Escherichia coli]|uniref:hypothetical protein n=1 Tax=Escherichia coli TaxID=562 RepID=UPI0027384217